MLFIGTPSVTLVQREHVLLGAGILTPGWHFNASQNEGSQYASEVVTTCPNLFLRLGRQGEHVLFGESVLVAGEFHILTICQDNKDI